MSNHGVISSPGVTQDLDGDGARPAKRAKTESHDWRESEEETRDVKNDTAHLVVPGSPLPTVRRPLRSASSGASSKGHRRAVVDRAARRANGLEPPSIATRLPAPKYVADFAPWTGNHPEDILSETVIKAGYFDKLPGPNSTESNSAKPTIWPNLSQKNNMGLQTLSYLFTQVMEKRQVMGRCTAPSTFKPPPRVTVTDTKREAWLRDLSNPDVPLRKQSRTIPHGIRGKLLMEQCLSKDIPMQRAIWLAKCVGANELRAFRRKGVSGAAAASGESKWITEWTVHVEQFLDGVISSCGHPQWQAKMNYAVKLATSFYTERLLDRDHYLDWIVDSFAKSVPDALPIWTIMVQLYWRDVVAFVRRGRKLAQAILEVLHQTALGNLWIGDALAARLKKHIVVLAVANRGCLIMPKTWEKYAHLLRDDALGSKHSATKGAVQNVMRRNSRLTRPLRKTPQSTRSAFLEMYSVLDSADPSVDVENITTTCLALMADVTKLVPALLSWSASVYRTDESRIHLAAGVLSELCKRGCDTDKSVMDFLTQEHVDSLLTSNLYRVVAELIRVGRFPPGRYLQWLMASGSLSRENVSSFSNGLLGALPLDSLPPHLLSSRNMLLRRLGSFEDERASIEASVASIHAGFSHGRTSDLDISALSGSAKLAVAKAICDRVSATAKVDTITLGYFCAVRTALELCGDYRGLADVLRSASDADDPALLGTIVDTVNMHAKTLGATGFLLPLLNQLLERYNTLRSQQPLDRKFIVALMSLTRRLPGRQSLVGYLEQDLALCEQQNSMNVCSPASDSIVSMQASNLASDSDIDAVFASGNNMDEQLMQRVFSRIVQRARKTALPDEQSPSKVCGWLDQLRAVAVDPSNFDQMAIGHVRACFKNAEQIVTPCNVITALVASGCTSFVSMASEAKTPTAASIMLRLLTWEANMQPGLHAAETYHYRVQQRLYRSTHVSGVIQLLATGMEHQDFSVEGQGLTNLILECAVSHRQDFVQSFPSPARSQAFLANWSRLATKLMRLGQPPGTAYKLEPCSIVAKADALSIVYCAGALKLFSVLAPDHSDEMQKAVLEAIASGSEVWPQLLESIGQDMIQDIYQWALDQVMSKAFEPSGSFSMARTDVIRSLDILDITFHAGRRDDCASVIPMITEKMKTVQIQLSNLNMARGGQEDRLVLHSLHVLLHLSILYSSDSDAASESLDQSQCQLLACLSTILVHPKLQGQQELIEYVYDVASILADNLSEANLSMLSRSVASKDPVLSSLFGTYPSPDAWLAIVSHPQTQATQQQRALMKQAGTQQPTSGRQSSQQSPVQQHGFHRTPARNDGRSAVETKTMPFPLRRWEIMSDATPMVGDNDTSLSLGLFGARKV